MELKPCLAWEIHIFITFHLSISGNSFGGWQTVKRICDLVNSVNAFVSRKTIFSLHKNDKFLYATDQIR